MRGGAVCVMLWRLCVLLMVCGVMGRGSVLCGGGGVSADEFMWRCAVKMSFTM